MCHTDESALTFYNDGVLVKKGAKENKLDDSRLF